MTAFLLVKIVLELRSPGGVAAPEQERRPEGVRLPLARTPWGEPYVPATSLAGSLRAHLGDRAPSLMGSGPGEERITASPLWVLGTHVDPTGTLQRVRTAIDRHRGSAATATLRSSEHLRPGSRVTAYLRLDDPSLGGELLDALADWSPTIGGGRTTGHGRAALVELRRRVIDLDTPEGRRAWLTSGGPEMFADALTEPVPLPAGTDLPPLLRLRWEIIDGLHVGSGTRSDGGHLDDEESAPSTALVVRNHQDRPYVPGSTWKGVLRSRCEFILRSLGAPACPPAAGMDGKTGHAPRQACGTCLICTAFGSTGDGEDAPSRRGLLVFDDSPIEDAEVVEQPHVALDRVFGGARRGLLFKEEVVRAGRLTLDVRAVGEVEPAVVALLTLACHDLHHGLAGVGASTTRGLGTLRLLGEAEELAAQRSRAVAVLADALRAETPGDTTADGEEPR